MKKLGAEITIVAPPTFLPRKLKKWEFRFPMILMNLKKGGCDLSFKDPAGKAKGRFFTEYKRIFQIIRFESGKAFFGKKRCFSNASRPDQQGVEISPEVADGPLSLINEQVSSGVSVRMRCYICWDEKIIICIL